EEFLDRLARYFDAGVQRMPPDEARDALDDWVRTHTAGLIEQSAVDVHENLVLALQDAVLFAAAWRTEFTSDDIAMDFAAPSGAQQVQALAGSFSVPRATADGWEAVRLPYDDALAMDVIL